MGEPIGQLPPCPECGGVMRELLAKRKYEGHNHRRTDPAWMHREELEERTIECVNCLYQMIIEDD